MRLRIFATALLAAGGLSAAAAAQPATIFVNGKVVTVDEHSSIAEGLAVEGDRITAVGSSEEIRRLAGPTTRVVDLEGRTVIPGLIDSHIHAIRDGLTYARRIDWADVGSLDEALETLRDAARASPPGTWIVVAGAWNINQIPERRTPTPAELDAVSTAHPIYVQHQFVTATLNRRAVETLDLTPQRMAEIANGLPVEVEVDAQGRPTGIIQGNGYGTTLTRLIAPALQLDPEEQAASTDRYFRVLNSVGLTGVIDQGDVQDDLYRPLFNLWQRSGLTLRVRYNLIPYGTSNGFRADQDIAGLEQLTRLVPPRGGDSYLRFLGFGELLDFSLFDGFLNIDRPITVTDEAMRLGEARASWAAANGYSINIHATHDSTAQRLLDIFERVNARQPIARLRWKIEHGENLSAATLGRMQSLGVGYSVQDRMLYGGDDYVRTRGIEAARRSPPIVSAMRRGIVVSGGTDGAVIAPYSPFASLQWMIDGRTATGAPTRSEAELASRMDALRIYTLNGAWGSFEERERGSLEAGKLADLVILDADYLTVPVDRIAAIRPLLTMVGGRAVYARGPYQALEERRTGPQIR